MRHTYLTALAIIAVCAVWLLTGVLSKPEPTIAASLADANATPHKASPTAPTRVRARTFHASPQTEDIVVRATTASKRMVDVRAMVSGRVQTPPIEVGTRVKTGDLLCQLDPADRKAWVAEGEAAVVQAKLEQAGMQKLQREGYQSETQAMAARAKLAGAIANLEQRRIELDRTAMRAPFDGIVETRQAELGAYLQVGQPCVTLIAADPILIVGQVPERDVAAVTLGKKGTAKLIDGRVVTGVVSFVAQAAQNETRTYRVEVTVANPDHSIRAGISTDLRIPRGVVNAQQISPALLALDDAGGVGVRIVNAEHIVQMVPVKIIRDDPDGVWVTGLPDEATIITVGQELVVAGDRVDIALEDDRADSEGPQPEPPANAAKTALASNGTKP